MTSSVVEVYQCFGGTYSFRLQARLKMEATLNSETLVNSFQTAWRYIPKNYDLHINFGQKSFVNYKGKYIMT
jgi:hypothetical protein